MLSADTFITSIRAARADGVLTAAEVQPALEKLAAASDVSDEIKAHVVHDLLATARSRGRRGGLRLGAGVAASLAAFVNARDSGKPGLWLDPPSSSTSSVSTFVNSVRRRPTDRRAIRRALDRLARAGDASAALKSAVVENLYLAAHRGEIDIRNPDALRAFLTAKDPTRQGHGWFL